MSQPFKASDGTVIWLSLKSGVKPEDLTQEDIDCLVEWAKEIKRDEPSH